MADAPATDEPPVEPEEVAPAADEATATEEEPVGAPPSKVKTDEELLTSAYEQLKNFYGSVDAEIVWEMLAMPTTCSFIRTVGKTAVAGRLMGGRAAKEAAAKLLQSKHAKAKALPVEAFVKLVRPLPMVKSTYSRVLTYEFGQPSERDAFVSAFLAQPDGFVLAAERAGCNQLKVLKASRVDKGRNQAVLYEEWDRGESALKAGPTRAPAALGVAPSSQEYSVLAEEGGDATTEASCCFLTAYDFKEQEECDAWLAHYLSEANGFAFATNYGGCTHLKLLQALDPPSRLLFYEEWDDQWAAQRFLGERVESGYLAQWFGAESALGKWTKLKDDSADVTQFTVPRAYEARVLASIRPVLAPDKKLQGGPEPHYSLPRYK